jgi:hypothetical protein
LGGCLKEFVMGRCERFARRYLEQKHYDPNLFDE